jgi:hypothetical protein
MPDDDIHISPPVILRVTEIAKRARDQIMGEIGEHIGPQPTDAESASIYCVALAMMVGDLVQREPDPKVPAHMINAAWK